MSSRSSSAGLTPADAAAGVLKKGLLLKQGAVVRSWKERYFRLTAQALSYYDPADYDATNPGSTSNKAKGSIMLSDVTAVTPLKSRGAFQVTVAANPTTGVAGRDYLLVAPSDTERKAWMEAIQRAMLAPSRSALVLRQATELQKRGQLCSREAEVIRAWLVSGRDEDVDAAIDVMAAAARVPASERGSDRMEGLLLDFRLAESEGQLLRSLQGLKTVFEEEDTTASIRDRLMDIAMSQYARSADRERDAAAAAGAAPAGKDKDKDKERAKSQPRERSGTGGAGAGEDGLGAGASDAGAAGGAGRDGDGAASGSRSRAASSHRGKLTSSSSTSGSGAASGGGLSPASWTPTCQDLLSLVLHAIAMRVHAAETGHAETLAALQAHPGEDAEEEAAAAAAAAAYETELAAAHGHGFEHADTGEGRDGAAHGDGASSGSGAAIGRSLQAGRGSSSSVSVSSAVSALGSGEEDLLAPLREEGRVTDDYVLGDKIGEGAYSVVYRALHAGTGEPVAIKVARKASLSPAELRRLVDEVVIMAGLDHVHVVRLHAFYEDGDAFYIVTELMTGGELFDRIVSRSVYGEREARDIVRTLAEALDYCHAHGVVHRDLKPENILLSSPDESRALIKIADMGFAKRLHPAYYAFFDARGARKADSYDMPPPPDKAAAIAAAAAAAASAAGASGTSPATTGAGATPAAPASGSSSSSSSSSSPSGLWDPSDLGLATSCGTPSYVSPEILLGKRYGPAVDMWSLGVIAYILLCGYAPFAASNQTDLFRLIVAGRYQFDSPYWDRVSPEAKDLIRRLLVTDPTRRATAREVLAHRWLQGTVSSVELSSTLGQMRLFQASRKQVIRRGPLRKVGHFVRSTKLRLFVLTSDALEYYEPEKDRDWDGDADGLGLAEPSASPVLSSQSGNSSFDSGLDAAGGPPSLLTPGLGPGLGVGSGSGGSSAHRVQSWRGTSTSDREKERSSASVATFTSAAPSVAGPSGLGSGGPASVSGGSGASVSGTGFLAIVGLGSGSARSERPKGSIPVRDIRGVCACDAAGKELPAQRVPSVGQSATVVPAHFAAAPPPLTVPGGSSLAPVPEGGADDDNASASASVVGPGGGGRAMSRTQSGGAGLLRSDSMGSTSGSGSGSGSALSGGAGFWFKIATAGGRDFLLCADSEASRYEWIRALTFTLQRGDLMRKAQVALAGERMAEAVALMKLAADWASLMAAPEAGGSGSGTGVGGAISRASLRLKSLADSAAASASSVATGIASAISSTVAPARPSVISSGGAAGAGPGGGTAAAAGGAGSQAQRSARASLFAGSNPMAGSGSGAGSSVAAGGPGPASVAGSVVGPGPGPGSVAGASAAGGSTGSGGSASAGGPGAPLPSTLSTVALRTHDPLTEDWGRATRIVSKVTRHKAALRARGSIGGAAYSPQLVPGANTATTAAGGGSGGSGGSPTPVGSLPKSLPAASPGKHAASSSSAPAQQSARSPAASKAPAPAAAAAAPTPASPSAEPAQVPVPVPDTAAAVSSVSSGSSGPSDAPTDAAALAAAAEAPAAAVSAVSEAACSEPAATIDAPAAAPVPVPAASEAEAGAGADADADADASSSAAAAAAAISSKAAALLGVNARAGVASAKAAALLGLDPKTGKPVVDAGPAPPPATSAKAAALLGLGGSMRMRTAAASSAAGAGTASSSRALPASAGSGSGVPAAAPEADAGAGER